MVRKRYTEEQIIGVLNEAEAGVRTADLCRKHGMSYATFCNWKAKYACLTVSELERLKSLEDENRCLKHIVAQQALDNWALKGAVVKRLLKPKARRIAASYAMEGLGLSERRAYLLTGVSPSGYRYEAKRGSDNELRKRMRDPAGERKRFGSPRLRIMLKREGLAVNHKRTERIYREEGLGLRRKRRRKGAAGARVIIPVPERPNQKWSMDFVSDITVTGRRFRALTIVDDYSRECPAIEVDTSLGGVRVVGVLERVGGDKMAA